MKLVTYFSFKAFNRSIFQVGFFPDIVSGDGVAAHDVQEVVPAKRHDGLQVGPLELGPLGRLQRGPGLQQSLNWDLKAIELKLV